VKTWYGNNVNIYNSVGKYNNVNRCGKPQNRGCDLMEYTGNTQHMDLIQMWVIDKKNLIKTG
jgi:hypothetical protein